jgi:hypothetical protein
MARSRLFRPSAIWRDKWLIISAFVLLWIVRIGLIVVGYNRLGKIFLNTAHLPPPGPALSMRISHSIAVAGYFVLRDTCLVRAFAAKWLLQLKKCGSEIQVGVRKGDADKMEAHAWLVSNDRIILGGDDALLSSYTLLTRLT